jgi:uncharacterized membrane protein
MSDTVEAIALIAGATGARCMTGLATVAGVAAAGDERAPTPVGHRLDRQIAGAAALAALGELVGDKLPNIGNRIDPAPLAGRVVAGALIGAAVAGLTGRDKKNAAVGGAVAAFLGAHLSFHFRRVLTNHMPAIAAALVEDVVVLGAAAAGARLLTQRETATALQTESAAGARRQIATARILTASTAPSRGERAPS